jgi:two-component system, NtrC family, response regulator AtoC
VAKLQIALVLEKIMHNTIPELEIEDRQGTSPTPTQNLSMQSLETMVGEIATTNIPVLLVGESGTGKDVYAHLIHRLSAEKPGKWKKISCATAEPKSLHIDLQEISKSPAGGFGTPHLFLDGIDELDHPCQKLLLSLMPDGELLGDEGKLRARVISSATRHPEKEVAAGRFRRELYFRINGVCMQMPALRERKEDIPQLLNYFLKKHADDLKKKIPELNSETTELLQAYPWPGNIRELENVARKMVVLGNPEMAIHDLRGDKNIAVHYERISSLKIESRAASRLRERELILQALQRTKWNRKRAALELQISYKSLLYKIKQIETPSVGKED